MNLISLTIQGCCVILYTIMTIVSYVNGVKAGVLCWLIGTIIWIISFIISFKAWRNQF